MGEEERGQRKRNWVLNSGCRQARAVGEKHHHCLFGGGEGTATARRAIVLPCAE